MSSLLSQEVRLADPPDRSLYLCQEFSPTSSLITFWYLWPLIGSFWQQMMPSKMMMRTNSRLPVNTRLMITSGNKKKKHLNSIPLACQIGHIVIQSSAETLPRFSVGSWHSLLRSSEMENLVILTKSSRGQSRAQPGNCKGYGGAALSFRKNIRTEAELHA